MTKLKTEKSPARIMNIFSLLRFNVILT